MVVEAEERRGILLVLSSPSGAGKTTLSRRVLAADSSFTLSVSVTTRPPRENEREGIDYFFVSSEQFETMAEEGDLLERARVFGHAYGTPRGPVKQAILAGRDVLFDVDWQGAQQLRASDLGQYVVSVFVLPPSIAALSERLTARGLDSPDVIAARMERARDEISHWAEYDYVLINDNLDTCFSKIGTIVTAERLQWRRQRWLFPFIDRLNREFEEMDR